MRVLRYWRLGLVATLATLGAVGVALAQPVPTYPECTTKKASPQDNEAAKNAHRVATQFYDRADYDKAIQYWNDAFKFDCTVNDLLVNIANAYEKKGDKAATVATLEEYLKRTGPNSTIQAKVTKLKEALAPPTPSVTATASAPPTTTATPTATATAAPTAPPPEGPRPYGNKPWILVGSGGVLAVVGAILLPLGYGKVSDAESHCPMHSCNGNPALADEGNTGRKMTFAGWGLLAPGAAAVIGGLVWQLAANKPGPLPPGDAGPKTGRKVWVTPTAGARGQSGVVVGGSF
jgi:hypothetical protein